MDTTKKIAVMLGVCFMTSLSVAGATFHPGDKGHQITEIQQALTAHGYDTDADGDYGDSTRPQSVSSRQTTDWIVMASLAPLRMKPHGGSHAGKQDFAGRGGFGRFAGCYGRK